MFELDEAMYYAGLRAAAQRVPFNPWRSGVGTSFPEMNPAIKVFKDPINGETLLAIPAIDIDIAFLHAAVSDAYGNVQYIGHGYGDRAIYAAADATFVQVEQIVSNEEIRRDPLRTAIPGRGRRDPRALRRASRIRAPATTSRTRSTYASTCAPRRRGRRTDDFAPLEAYLDRIRHRAGRPRRSTCERVGLRRLLSLDEY